MAVDVTLWIILAAIVAWIYCGCALTAGNKAAKSAAKSATKSATNPAGRHNRP